MAQQQLFEDTLQKTQSFGKVENGEIFICNDQYCVKIDNASSPNYVVIGTGDKGRLLDRARVVIPNKILIKVE